MGMVMSKAERVTDVSFAVDDGTGRIDCIRWYLKNYLLLGYKLELETDDEICSVVGSMKDMTLRK